MSSKPDALTETLAKHLRGYVNGSTRPLWDDIPETKKAVWRGDAALLIRLLAREGITLTFEGKTT